jgi:predicted dehydrogenase
MIKTELAGISGYGSTYLKLLRDTRLQETMRLEAATVINMPEEASEVAALRKAGVRLYSDFYEMLEAEAGRIDLCLIPTPIHCHVDMTCAALESGFHVLVEKPLTAPDTTFEHLHKLAQANRLMLAVGFQEMYSPETQALKHLLSMGVLGQLEKIHGLGCRSRPLSYFRRNAWAGKLHMNGVEILDSPMNNAVAHTLQAMLFLAGEDIEAAAEVELEWAELLRAQPIESFDTVCLKGRCAGGASLHFLATHSCFTDLGPQIFITASKGTITWVLNGECRVDFKDRPSWKIEVIPEFDKRVRMLKAIASRLHGGAGFICDLNLAQAHTRLVRQVHRQYRILDVPGDLLERYPVNDGRDEQIAIAGIEDKALMAHQHGGRLALIPAGTQTETQQLEQTS